MELHEELQGTTVILVGDRQCRVMETADELEAAIDGEWDRIKGRSASDGSVSADG